MTLGAYATCFFLNKPKLNGFVFKAKNGRFPIYSNFGLKPGELKRVTLKLK